MPKKTVLIIEDDASVSNMVKTKLESSDYNVITAEGAKEGLDILLENNVNLIITDVIMPGEMDGFHLFKEIKNNNVLSNIPFIVITGRGAMKDTFELFDVDAFFTKPFSLEELAEKIKELLEKKAILLGDDAAVSQNLLADLQKIRIDLQIDSLNNLPGFKEKINAGRYALIVVQESAANEKFIELCLELRSLSSKNKNTPLIIHSKSPLKISLQKYNNCEVIIGDYESQSFSFTVCKYL